MASKVAGVGERNAQFSSTRDMTDLGVATMTTKKILLINGNSSVREVVQVCLSHLGGWEVIEIDAPNKGLQQAIQAQPDAIVLDLSSSGMDYGTFLQRLRAQPATQATPVVVLTTGIKWLNLKRLQPFQVAGAIEYCADPTEIPKQIAKLLNWNKEPAQS
ncbi:MAG: response regulator [Elainellaceae cyanobacterium]